MLLLNESKGVDMALINVEICVCRELSQVLVTGTPLVKRGVQLIHDPG